MLVSHALLACLFTHAEPVDRTVYTVQQRAFRVPVKIESRSSEIERILLFVSADQGKTWQEAGTIGPEEESFRYLAPGDGVYWFAVQIALKNKSKEPPDVLLLEPALKVTVQTPKKPEWQQPLSELEEEVKQLRAEVKRLKERLAAVEKLLKEKP
jgi:hypothetical protein